MQGGCTDGYDDARQLGFVIAAATEYSSERFIRKVKACLSNLLRPVRNEAGGASGILSFSDHQNDETDESAIVHAPTPLLIRALQAAHREIRNASTVAVLLEALSDASVIPPAVLCSSVVPFYVIPTYIKIGGRGNAASTGGGGGGGGGNGNGNGGDSTDQAVLLMNYLSRWMDEFPSLPPRALETVRRFSKSTSLSYGKSVVLELYQHWFRACPRLRIAILTDLGNWLAEQDVTCTAINALKKRQRDIPGLHQTRKRRRHKISSLNLLHDGGSSSSSDEDEEAIRRFDTVRHARLALPLGQQSTQNSPDAIFTFTLFQATVELCHRLMTLSSHYEALIPRCSDVRSLVVSILLAPQPAAATTMSLHDVSSLPQRERHKFTMRLLCALAVVNYKPDVVVDICLSRHRYQLSVLIYVVELLMECQFYDNKRHLLAVLDQIAALSSGSGDSSWQQTLWKCLWTKRKKLLMDSTNQAVQRLLRDKIVVNDDDDEDSLCLLYLRSTMDLLSSPRLRPSSQCKRAALRFPNDFLSLYSPANAMPPQEHTRQALENGHLSDECWFQIASFLNYKRVCKLRQVSSSLNNILGAPLLWKHLYESRYTHHPVNQDEAQQLFRERIAAERAIRGRCCQSDLTWRVQLCPVPGCLHVLTTRARAAAHARSHRLKNKKKPKRSRRATPKKSSTVRS